MAKNDEYIEDIEQMTLLEKSIRFNHDKDDKFVVMVDPDYEIENYQTGMTQLTLPHRFGMYKTPTKDVPKTTEIELEEPKDSFIDSTSSRLAKNPNHKVRGIFG